jgi:integrase
MGVYKRGKTWTSHPKWTDHEGIPRQKPKGGFPTKKAAQKHHREYLSSVQSGRQLGGSSPIFSKYLLDDWLPSHLELAKLKASTYETYMMHILVYINPHLGHLRLDEIRTQHLERFYIEMQTNGRRKTLKSGGNRLSPKTVRNFASIIQKALRDAVRLNLIAFNPSDSAQKPKLSQPEIDFMTPDNLIKYVASIQGHRYGPPLQLVALTGMRRGELLGLSWNDVDFKAGTINIHQTRIRAGNRTIFDTPKSKKSKRVIEIDLDTMQKLQSWKIAQNVERLALGGAWTDKENLVVTDATGSAPSFSAFDRMFKRTLREIGLIEMKFHSLRHSYVIAALRSGGALKSVSERVGHGDTSITQRLYNHVIEGDDRALADSTAAFILGKVNEVFNAMQEEAMASLGYQMGNKVLVNSINN